MSSPPLSYVPALPAAVGLAGGIALTAVGAPLWCSAVAMAAFLVLYLKGRHYTSFLYLMTAVGMLTAEAHRAPLPPRGVDNDRHTFTAEVRSADVGHSTISYLTDITAIDGRACREFACLVTVNTLSGELEQGDTLTFTGQLTLAGSRPPALPGMPDRAAWLIRQGVYATAFVEPDEAACTGRATGLQGWLNSVRRSLYNAVVTSPVNGPTASFLTAVILADDRFIGPSSVDAFRSTGVAHMLALSGMHVGIMAMLVGLVLYPLGRGLGGRRWRALLTIAAVWMYVAVVGSSPSVTRAAVMITAMLAAGMLQRRHSGWNSLCLSVAVLLAVRPSWLFSPGFLMSVAAVASIMAFGGVVPLRLKRRPWLYHTLNAVVTPVAAMLGTGMVGACFFGTVPVMFLPANIVAGLLFPVILVCGVVMMLGRLCALDLTWVGFVADTVYAAMTATIDYLASVAPAVKLHVSWWTAVPYTAMLVCLAAAVKLRRRPLLVLAAGLGLCSVAVALAATPSAPAGEMFITARRGNTEVIVRRGDSVWIRPFFNARSAMQDLQGTGSTASTQNADGQADSTLTLQQRLREEYLADCRDAYEGYLLLRSADSVLLMPAELETPEFYSSARAMVCGSTTVYIDHVPPGRPSSTVYCLVSDAYRGDAAGLRRADTLLLGADLHGSRRKRLIRECADSIPWIDIRERPLAITW